MQRAPSAWMCCVCCGWLPSRVDKRRTFRNLDLSSGKPRQRAQQRCGQLPVPMLLTARLPGLAARGDLRARCPVDSVGGRPRIRNGKRWKWKRTRQLCRAERSVALRIPESLVQLPLSGQLWNNPPTGRVQCHPRARPRLAILLGASAPGPPGGFPGTRPHLCGKGGRKVGKLSSVHLNFLLFLPEKQKHGV